MKIEDLIDKRKCAKQVTIAVVVNGDEMWIGSNWCENPQSICPRKNMKTGCGYELCKDICGQLNHAEVDACKKAKEKANGATLYLLGHTYCCDNCKKVMDEYGISNVIIGNKIPEGHYIING